MHKWVRCAARCQDEDVGGRDSGSLHTDTVCVALCYNRIVVLHMVAVVGLSVRVVVLVLQYNCVASVSACSSEQCVAIVVSTSDLLSVAPCHLVVVVN
jgi:hypothetical protein